jgi:hypothetical protein
MHPRFTSNFIFQLLMIHEGIRLEKFFDSMIKFRVESRKAQLIDIRHSAHYDLMSYWEGIVHRSLTKPTDKLPALSGIAAEYQRVSGDTYLAGLWKSNLPWGLLWGRLFNHKEEPIPPPKPEAPPLNTQMPEYICPSWSFASTSDRVTFEHPLSWQRTTKVEIHSVETTPSEPLAHLGKAVCGKLTMTGPMRCMHWEQIMAHFAISLEGNSTYVLGPHYPRRRRVKSLFQ